MLNISVIIPHAGGREILRRCLKSLADSASQPLETVIVHNGPVDDVDNDTLSGLENVHVLRYECNLGFAPACNRGVEAAKGDLVFLLNNDATVEPDCLAILAQAFEGNETTGAVQPKIRSLVKRDHFDYSSGAGGEMDRYGFPFARGRVFDTLEIDEGQYNDARQVFWGAGAALMIRRGLYLEAGGLEEPFFAHMEEIDFLWRIQLMGYKVFAFPQAVAWHEGAITIKAGSFRKHYLNHRNSLATLFRNYSFFSVASYLPLRLGLDVVLSLYSLLQRDFVRLFAVVRANCWFWASLPYLISSRKQVQRLRRVPEKEILDRLYSKPIVWQYFIRKKRTWKQLNDPNA